MKLAEQKSASLPLRVDLSSPLSQSSTPCTTRWSSELLVAFLFFSLFLIIVFSHYFQGLKLTMGETEATWNEPNYTKAYFMTRLEALCCMVTVQRSMGQSLHSRSLPLAAVLLQSAFIFIWTFVLFHLEGSLSCVLPPLSLYPFFITSEFTSTSLPTLSSTPSPQILKGIIIYLPELPHHLPLYRQPLEFIYSLYYFSTSHSLYKPVLSGLTSTTGL